MDASGGRFADFLRVRVPDKLIVSNRQQLKQKVLDELERGQRKFLIDFTDTGYLDSSALGALVLLSKRIREHGGELRLANLNDDLRSLFELTRLDTLFQIVDEHDGPKPGRPSLRWPRPPGPAFDATDAEPPPADR